MRVRIIEMRNPLTGATATIRVLGKNNIVCMDSHGRTMGVFNKMFAVMDFMHSKGFKSHRQYEVDDDKEMEKPR